MASPLRLNAALIEAAEREGAVQKRSVPRQIEFWAELGKAVESVVGPADVVAVIQGIKRIKVEPVASIAVDPGDVFDSIETDRKSGALGKKVTSAAIYYQTSLSQPGLLDRVNASTGERQTGLFRNGEFKGTIIPVKSRRLNSVAEHPFFNMAADEPSTVQDQMNTLRESRFNDF
jgi:hypothetical protein